MSAFDDLDSALAQIAGDIGLDFAEVANASVPAETAPTSTSEAAATIVPPTTAPMTPAPSVTVSPNVSADSGGTESSVAGHKRKRTQTKTWLEESSAAASSSAAAASGRPAKVARRSRPSVSPELAALRQQREEEIARMRSVLEAEGYTGERLEETLARMLRDEQQEWDGGEPDPALQAVLPRIDADDAGRHIGRVLHLQAYSPLIGTAAAGAAAAGAASAVPLAGTGGGGHLAAALRAVEAALRGAEEAAAGVPALVAMPAATAASAGASSSSSAAASAAPPSSLAAAMGTSPLAASAAALRAEMVRQWTEMHLPPLQATAGRQHGMRAGCVTVAPGLHVVVDEGRFLREGRVPVFDVGAAEGPPQPLAAATSPRPASTSSAGSAALPSPHAASADAVAAAAAAAATSPSARATGGAAAAVKREHSAASTASAASTGSASAPASAAAATGAAPVSPSASAPGGRKSGVLGVRCTKPQALLLNLWSPRNGTGPPPGLSPTKSVAPAAGAADVNVPSASAPSAAESSSSSFAPSAAAVLRRAAALDEMELHDRLHQQLAELRAGCRANACAVGPPINVLPSLAADCSVYRAMAASSGLGGISGGMLNADVLPSGADDPLATFRGVATGLVRRFGWDKSLLGAGAATETTRNCSILTGSHAHASEAAEGVPLLGSNCPSPADPAAVMRACVDALAADPAMALATTIGCGHGYGLHTALLPALMPIDDTTTEPPSRSAGAAIAASALAAAPVSPGATTTRLPLQQLLGLPTTLHLGSHAGLAGGGGGLASDTADDSLYGGGAAVRMSFSGQALPHVSVAVAADSKRTSSTGASVATPTRSASGSGIAPPFSQRGGVSAAAAAAPHPSSVPTALLRCIGDAMNGAAAPFGQLSGGPDTSKAAQLLPIEAFLDTLRRVGCVLDGAASGPPAVREQVVAASSASAAAAPIATSRGAALAAHSTLDTVVSAATAPLLSALRDRQLACTLICLYADALAFSIAQHAVTLGPAASAAATSSASDLRIAPTYSYASASLEQLAAVVCRLLMDPTVRGVVVPASRIRPMVPSVDDSGRSQAAAARRTRSDDDSGSDGDDAPMARASAAATALTSAAGRPQVPLSGDVLACGATTIDGRSPVDAASFLAHTVGGAAIGRAIATANATGLLASGGKAPGAAPSSSSSSSSSSVSGVSGGASHAPTAIGTAAVALAARRMPTSVPALMRLLCTVADVLAWRELIGSLTVEERTITATGKRVASAVRRSGSGGSATAPGTPARAGSGAGAASGRSPSRMLSPVRAAGADDSSADVLSQSSSAVGAPSLLRPHDAVAADMHFHTKEAAFTRYYNHNSSTKGHEEAALLPPHWAMHVVDAVVPALLPEAFQAIDAVHGAANGAGVPAQLHAAPAPLASAATGAAGGATSGSVDSAPGASFDDCGSATSARPTTIPDTRATAAAFSTPVQHSSPGVGALLTLTKTLQQHVSHAAAPRLYAYPAALVPVCAVAASGGAAAPSLAINAASASTTESVLTISSSESSSPASSSSASVLHPGYPDYHAHTLRLSWSCYSVACANNSPLGSLARQTALISANAATLLWYPRRTLSRAAPRVLSAVEQDWRAAIERRRSAHPPVIRDADDRGEHTETEGAESADDGEAGRSSSSSSSTSAASSSAAGAGGGAAMDTRGGVGTAADNRHAHATCTAGIMRFNEILADDPTVALPLVTAVPTVLLSLEKVANVFGASGGGAGRPGAFVFPTRYDLLRLPNKNPVDVIRSLLERVTPHINLAKHGDDVSAVAARLEAAGGDATMLSASMKVLERQMVATQIQLLRTALLLGAAHFPPPPAPPTHRATAPHAPPTTWMVSPDGDPATTTIGTTGLSLLITGGTLASLEPGRLPVFSGVGALAALPRAVANRLRPLNKHLQALIAAPLLSDMATSLTLTLDGRSTYDMQAAVRGMLWVAELPLPVQTDEHDDGES